MQKIVINKCYGGFNLSTAALVRYRELTGSVGVDAWQIARDDAVLVRLVEEMGKKAGGPHSDLKVVEVPEGVNWEIAEYDGIEWVAEVHRTWK